MRSLTIEQILLFVLFVLVPLFNLLVRWFKRRAQRQRPDTGPEAPADPAGGRRPLEPADRRPIALPPRSAGARPRRARSRKLRSRPLPPSRSRRAPRGGARRRCASGRPASCGGPSCSWPFWAPAVRRRPRPRGTVGPEKEPLEAGRLDEPQAHSHGEERDREPVTIRMKYRTQCTPSRFAAIPSLWTEREMATGLRTRTRGRRGRRRDPARACRCKPPRPRPGGGCSSPGGRRRGGCRPACAR